MSRSRKKYTPFAFAEKADGTVEHFVEVKAVMHPLVPFIDGLTMVRFGKEKRWYLRLEVALEWATKEYEQTQREEDKKRMEALQEVDRRSKAGTYEAQ